MRYAIVRDGVIENVVLWDGAPGWAPPEGTQLCELSQEDRAEIGWAWDGAPVVPPKAPDPQPPTAAEKLAAAGLTVAELKQVLGLE